MGCRILIGHEQESNIECACFFDSVTNTVFGCLMEDEEEAESFKEWVTEKKKLYEDMRLIPNEKFEELLSNFREEREEKKNNNQHTKEGRRQNGVR